MPDNLGEIGRRFLEDLKTDTKPKPSPEESDMVRMVREIMATEKKASGEIPMMGIRQGPPSLPPIVDMTFFYRMTGDWKRYDLFPLKRDPIYSSPYMGNLKAKIEPYRFYDAKGVGAEGRQLVFFNGPSNQEGERRSLLETNAEGPGGSLFGYPSRRFVFSTTVLRVSPDYRKVMKDLLWSGVYRFSTTYNSEPYDVSMPLSSFVPLNPLDPEPMVFAAIHRQFIIAENQIVLALIEFPKGEDFGGYGIVLELPGILVWPAAPVYYRPGQKEPDGPQGSQDFPRFQGPQGSNDPNQF